LADFPEAIIAARLICISVGDGITANEVNHARVGTAISEPEPESKIIKMRTFYPNPVQPRVLQKSTRIIKTFCVF